VARKRIGRRMALLPCREPWEVCDSPFGTIRAGAAVLLPVSLTWDSWISARPGEREGAQGCDLF